MAVVHLFRQTTGSKLCSPPSLCFFLILEAICCFHIFIPLDIFQLHLVDSMPSAGRAQPQLECHRSQPACSSPPQQLLLSRQHTGQRLTVMLLVTSHKTAVWFYLIRMLIVKNPFESVKSCEAVSSSESHQGQSSSPSTHALRH